MRIKNRSLLQNRFSEENPEAEEAIPEQEPSSTQGSEGEEYSEQEIQSPIEEQNSRNPDVEQVTAKNIKEKQWITLTAESFSKIRYILDQITFS